jgi:microcystin-dependent protein
MSRRLVKDDTNQPNIIISGADTGTGTTNITLSGANQGDIIKAFKGIFQNELNVANLLFAKNLISVQNPQEAGSQIAIKAPTLNLQAGNIVFDSDQSMSYTDILTSRVRLATPLLYMSKQPSDGDIGMVFQYFDSNLGTNTQVGFLGFNAKDKKFRLYNSTNRPIDNIFADNTYLTREQYIGATGAEFNPVVNEATVNYLGDLQLRVLEAKTAIFRDAIDVNNLTVGSGNLVVNSLGAIDMSGNLNINNGTFTVDALTGDVRAAGRLDIGSNFTVNTNKFIVNSFSGNTTVAGILTTLKDLIVGVGKMVVEATTGNTSIAGTLRLADDLFVGGTKYVVDAQTGNTQTQGTLDVAKTTTIGNNTLIVDTSLNTVSINTTDKTFPLNVEGDINITGVYRRNGSPIVDSIPVGTIIPYGNTTPPTAWLVCDGSELSRADYPDLFQVIGTTYGSGDGSTTFNIPDLRGREVIGSGSGPNLTTRPIGQMGGEERHVLLESEMPNHTHDLLVTGSKIGGEFSSGGIVKNVITGDRGGDYATTTSEGKDFLSRKGGNQPFNVMQPFTVACYIIKAVPIMSIFGMPFNHWTKTQQDQIHYQGQVGIGTTTPLSTLHVNGSIIQTGSFTTQLKQTTVDGHFMVYPTTDHRVGIGTTDLTYTVNVAGDLNITGNYRVNGIPISLGNGTGSNPGPGFADAIPVGTIMPFGAESVPQNWLKCDGSPVSRTEYPDLFDAIGVTYGPGDGSTTFNLPDLRGRDVVGSGLGPGLTQRSVGQQGGEERHVMTENEMPAHNHRLFNTTSHIGGEFSSGGEFRDLVVGDRGGAYMDMNVDGTQFVEDSGTNAPFNVMQPFTVCNYIIKAVPIVSILTQPFNFWRKSIGKLYYTASNVGIGTTAPQATLHVEGSIKQTGSQTTELRSTTVDGFHRVTIKPIGANNGSITNYVPGGFVQVDPSTGSNFSIELDAVNGTLTVGFVNVTPECVGQSGKIYLFERAANRTIYFPHPIVFKRGTKPTTLPIGDPLLPTMCCISYTIVKTDAIACTFDVFD